MANLTQTPDQSTGVTPPPRPPTPQPSPEPAAATVQEIANSIEAFMALLPILTEFPEAIRNPDTMPIDAAVLGRLLTEGLNYFADLVDWEIVREGFEGGVIGWGEEGVSE